MRLDNFDLGDTESQVAKHVQLLDAALRKLESIHQEIAQLESEASMGLDNHAGTGYAPPGGIYSVGQSSTSYNPRPSGDQAAQLEHARRDESATVTQINVIVQTLNEHGTQVQAFKKEIYNKPNIMASLRGKLNGPHQINLYRQGESALLGDIGKCEQILSTIHHALQRAGTAPSGGSGRAPGWASPNLDDIAAKAPAIARAHDDYVQNTLRSAILYALDTGRYGRIDEVFDYPSPLLGGPGEGCAGSLSDKIALGYFSLPQTTNYPIPLPEFYRSLRRREYTPKDGQYVVIDPAG